MRKVLFNQTNSLLAQSQNKTPKVLNRILIIPNTSIPYLFEIESGANDFGNEDEMDPDDMTDIWYRRRLRERGEI